VRPIGCRRSSASVQDVAASTPGAACDPAAAGTAAAPRAWVRTPGQADTPGDRTDLQPTRSGEANREAGREPRPPGFCAFAGDDQQAPEAGGKSSRPQDQLVPQPAATAALSTPLRQRAAHYGASRRPRGRLRSYAQFYRVFREQPGRSTSALRTAAADDDLKLIRDHC
jgi:hypothetical protein